MQVFNEYSKYYDYIYGTKDYEAEAKYIHKLITKYKPGSKYLLDIGCGTGRHALEFAKLHYVVTGVDSSRTMIANAINRLKANYNMPNLPTFFQQDARSLHLEDNYDAIVLLFHVFSYFTSVDDLEKSLESITRHLKPDGILVFDYWHGPAVLFQKPDKRINYYQNDNIHITRKSDPKLYQKENIVCVNYHLIVRNNNDNTIQEIKERHQLRYFYPEEIANLLAKFRLKLVNLSGWMTADKPDHTSWSACAVAIFS